MPELTIRGAVLDTIGATTPFAESTPIRVRSLTLGEPGPREVLVRIEVASVCHSDLSVVTGARPRPVPMLLGHEAAGIVERLGAEVTDLTVGQRVVMTFLPRCGECRACRTEGRAPCERGSYSNGAGTLLDGEHRIFDGDESIAHHLGVSGFADHAVVDERSVVAVDDDVPADVAALLGCAVLTGGGAVVNSGALREGETLIVIVIGGVGLAALLVGLSHDNVRVIGIDRLADKLSKALELGAHAVYTPEQAIAEGVMGDLVVEAVGRASAFENAIQLTAPGGRTVTVGLPAADDLASVSPLGLVAQGRSIVGSYLGGSVPSRDIPRFVELWRAGRLPVERLVSSEIRLDQLNEAMDDLAAGIALRQIIRFSHNHTSR